MRSTPCQNMVLSKSPLIESRNDKPYVTVSFRDNGCGIPAEQQATIFELNYTTKKEGNFGLGIGLSICHQIIHSHGG
nr:HAMP domain-containing sensor histidine kinase [Vibrio sp. 03_296]